MMLPLVASFDISMKKIPVEIHIKLSNLPSLQLSVPFTINTSVIICKTVKQSYRNIQQSVCQSLSILCNNVEDVTSGATVTFFILFSFYFRRVYETAQNTLHMKQIIRNISNTIDKFHFYCQILQEKCKNKR